MWSETKVPPVTGFDDVIHFFTLSIQFFTVPYTQVILLLLHSAHSSEVPWRSVVRGIRQLPTLSSRARRLKRNFINF